MVNLFITTSKIIYQSFESSMQKLTMGEAEMFFLNIVLYAPKAW